VETYQRLEAELARWLEVAPEHVVTCASGTAALHLALESFRLSSGAEVLVPDYTMVACARAVTLAGLTPVFVDCREDLNLNTQFLPGVDIYDFEAGDRPSVIMAVHVYGRQCDMTSVHLWANRYPKFVVEDMAEIHGVKPHPDTDAACWSFYKNKIIAGEEGGAIYFKDKAIANYVRSLRCLGFTDSHDFRHIPRGHNYRMSNAHAYLILSSLHAYQNYNNYFLSNRTILDLRREIESWYEEHCPVEWRMPARQAPWVYDFRIKGLKKCEQDTVIRHLNNLGIQARHGFMPMSKQQEYVGCKVIGYERLAQKIYTEVLYLPIVPGVTTEEKTKLAFEEIRRVLGK
jgi:perosamine synthetase